MLSAPTCGVEIDRRIAEITGAEIRTTYKKCVAGIALGRAQAPEDVAAFVSYLTGPDSDYMTGQSPSSMADLFTDESGSVWHASKLDLHQAVHLVPTDDVLGASTEQAWAHASDCLGGTHDNSPRRTFDELQVHNSCWLALQGKGGYGERATSG